jgi:general secretion pathway protein F
LGPAIRRAIATRNLFQPVWQSIFPKIGYICFLPMAAFGLIAFMMLMIVPQYEKIFRDFNTKLPDITFAVIGVCHWPLLWMPLGAAWLLLGLLFLYSLLRYTGSLRGDLPGMHWLMRMRYRADVLDALALAAERQQPLYEALRIVAGSHPQRAIARRLAKVSQEARGGGDELQSLLRRGLLGAADLALLEAARRNGNFAWAAREMADSNRRRFIYRTYALLQMVFPAVVLGYGILTGIVFAAMFLPMVALIANLSGGR